MSSAEDEHNDTRYGLPRKPRDPKKRRVARACDICRRRKVRCDGGQGPGRKCANCAVANLECSYVQAMKKYPEGYVEALETKLEKFEALVKRLHPSEDFTREIGIPVTRDNWMLEGVLGDPDAVTIPSVYVDAGPGSAEASSDELDEIDEKLESLTRDMQRLHVGAFRGKSSGAAIVQAVLEIREEVSGVGNPSTSFMQIKRPEYWEMAEWEKGMLDRPIVPLRFPETDLMWNLVDAYFAHINVTHPILHRPTFVKNVQEELHLHDEAFGSVLLLVCAIGTRVADDRRVLSPLCSGNGSWHSAGWPWFSQVNLTQKSIFSNSRLYDLQLYCLSVIFLLGTSLTHYSWNLCGMGIRLALDIGAHRKTVYNDKPTAEDELYKRAFWVLIWLDRWLSTTLGRQYALQDDDFDLELPCDCDDDYWDPPDRDLAFKQPAGRPSRLGYFLQSIKLIRILGTTLNSIYGTGKARARAGFTGANWEQRAITDLEAQLRSWSDNLPEHLRWNPARQDRTFFVQSAHLHVQHNHIAILVHRPFISSRKDIARPFHSLTAALTAARSTSRVADALRRRLPSYLCPYLQIPVMVAGVMLHLGVWHIKRSGLSVNEEKETEGVYKCMHLLADTETRWQSAGRLWDVVSSLTGTSVRSNGSADDGNLQKTLKRNRGVAEGDADTDDHSSPSASSTAYASSSATAYTSSPPSASSSSPLAPAAHNMPDVDIRSHAQTQLPPIHSAAAFQPQQALSYEPLQSLVAQPAPTSHEANWGNFYTAPGPGPTFVEGSGDGYYQRRLEPHSTGAYDPYDDLRTQETPGQDFYGSMYAAGTAVPVQQSNYPAYRGVAAPEYGGHGGGGGSGSLPPHFAGHPLAQATDTTWRTSATATPGAGSLADAVPPEYRWHLSQTQGHTYDTTGHWAPGSGDEPGQP